MDRQVRKLVLIVIATFLLPVLIVASTLILNGTFTYEEFISKILPAWQFPVFTGVFWLGTPIFIHAQLEQVKKHLKAAKYEAIHPYYKRIIFSYIGLSAAYSLAAALIPASLGYPAIISWLAMSVGLLFIGVTNLPLFLIFINNFDNLLGDVNIKKSSSLTVNFKFALTASMSSIAGVGIVLVSAGVLVWRLLYYPEWELSFESLIYRLTGISIFIVGLQILPNMILGKNIAHNLRNLQSYARQLGRKDLLATVEIHNRDEFGYTSTEIHKMGIFFREIIAEIRNNTKFLKNSSAELNNLAILMSESSSNQAASAQELAASMEEMTSNISVSSDNASASEEISKEARGQIMIGQKSMQSTLKNIKEITNKVDLVQKIAGQTNLLAVNASIEASSAGVHGKGFAVIAREVRELADQSKLSATEITELAATCHNESNDLKEKIDELVDQIRQNADMASNIASASKEQQRGSDQINITVQSLNNNAQQLAASSEELSASSQELNKKASLLENMISDFNV